MPVSDPFIFPVFRPERKDACFCGSGKRFKSCCGSMSESREPPYGVHVVPGFLDPQICRAWVEFLEQQPREASRVFDASRSTAANPQVSLKGGRTSQEISLGKLVEPVNEVVAQCFHNSAPLFGREIEWFEQPKVLRYGPGNSYGVHADNCYRASTENFWTKKIDRDISLLMYLNEDFVGGSLSFEKFFYSYQPKVGDLLLFPSDNRYKHSANPVHSGIRYAIVSWGAFLGEPRVHATPIAKTVLMSNFP
jgi:predicted 2-oxoglutarate/Fe(II)-dependent dioxygenase YbiX